MLRLQAGDQPQDRALAAAAGPEDADELALVEQVLDDEGHVADGRERVGLAGVVGLGDAAGTRRRAGSRTSLGRLHVVQHLAHPDSARGGDVGGLPAVLARRLGGRGVMRSARSGVGGRRALPGGGGQDAAGIGRPQIKPLEVFPAVHDAAHAAGAASPAPP